MCNNDVEQINVEFLFSRCFPKHVIWDTFWKFENSKFTIRKYNQNTFDTNDDTFLLTPKIMFIFFYCK